MKTEIENAYFSWDKASLETELKTLQRLRVQYLKEMDFEDNRLRGVITKIKQVNQSLAMFSKPKLFYIQNEGQKNEAVYDLDKQEIRFTNYPNLLISNVSIVPNSKFWAKVKK